jgi:hypothetical protein
MWNVFDYDDFDYSKAEITVSATRLEKPPRMDEIIYELSVYSQDSSLNIDLCIRISKILERYSTRSRLPVLLWVKLKK